MNVRQYDVDFGWVANFLVAAVIGLSLGTMLSGDPVSVPPLGAVSGVAAGAVGLLVGGALYTRLPDCSCGGGEESGCGCGDDCGC